MIKCQNSNVRVLQFKQIIRKKVSYCLGLVFAWKVKLKTIFIIEYNIICTMILWSQCVWEFSFQSHAPQSEAHAVVFTRLQQTLVGFHLYGITRQLQKFWKDQWNLHSLKDKLVEEILCSLDYCIKTSSE